MYRITEATTLAAVCACAFLAQGVHAELSASLGLSSNNLQKNGIAMGKKGLNQMSVRIVQVIDKANNVFFLHRLLARLVSLPASVDNCFKAGSNPEASPTGASQ